MFIRQGSCHGFKMKKLANKSKQFSVFEKHNNLVWDDVRSFLAVARTGTLSTAATVLRVGVATLSRRIDRLENALNVPLFTRQQSGYQLTEEGQRLVEKAEALEHAAFAFGEDALQQAQLTGSVRLATAENLAAHLILPALPKFRADHPNLLVELITDIATANIHRRDADIAVRMVKPERGHTTVKRIGTLGYGLYGSKNYVRQRDSSVEHVTFETDEFVSWGETHAHLLAAQWVKRVLRGRLPAVTTTSLATQIAATKAGLGLAVLPHFLAREAGLALIDTEIGIEQPIYLVIQADLAQSHRIRALADFLSDLIAKNKARLRGY